MVVDEMESMQPRKMQFMSCQPIILPMVNPTVNIITSSVMAVMAPVAPTCFRRLKLNSNPKAKSRNTTPILPHTLISATSVMPGNRLNAGPIRKPATM